MDKIFSYLMMPRPGDVQMFSRYELPGIVLTPAVITLLEINRWISKSMEGWSNLRNNLVIAARKSNCGNVIVIF